MKWMIVVAVILAVTATIAVNALLLSYGTNHSDPVGRLSPIADLPPASSRPSPKPTTTVRPDDGGGRSHVADD